MNDAMEDMKGFIERLRQDDAKILYGALAREIGSHLNLRSSFGQNQRGELGARDVELIFERFSLILRTILPSERGPEHFRKPGPTVVHGQLQSLEQEIGAEAARRIAATR